MFIILNIIQKEVLDVPQKILKSSSKLVTNLVFYVIILLEVNMGKIISITNQKGGVGKTTTCVNLAAFIAKAGYKVLIIDMDPQGNASSAVGVEPTKDDFTIYEVLIGECSAKEATYNSVMEGLDVIPSTVDLSGAEVELVHLNNRENILKEALMQAKRDYDFIFIDCPPSLSLLTVNALTATDSIIIPIQCEYFALVGLGQLMNTVKLIKKHLNPAIEIEGVLLTMKDARSNLVNQVAEEIQKYFKEKVYNTYIPRNIRLAESPSHGKPITMYDSKSKGSIAYQNLANEFLASNRK